MPTTARGDAERARAGEGEREGSESAPYVMPRTSLPLINVTLITWPRVCWLHLRSLCTLFAHSALESLVVALIELTELRELTEQQRRMSRTIHKNAKSIAFFALWHLSFLRCVFCVCWLEALRKINTHRQTDTQKWHEWERERETGKWKLATGKGSRQMHLENRHTKWTCVGSYNDDNWARQKTTQIRCSTTTDCRSRETQQESDKEREGGRERLRERDWYTISPFAVAVHDACQRQPISRGSAVSVQAFV